MLDIHRYDALIFDMDGTLVDSSRVIIQVLTEWCQQHQLDFDRIHNNCQGARIIDFLPILAPHLDCQREAEVLDKMEETYTDGLVEVAGAADLLRYLCDSNIDWGIATSASHKIASLRLQTSGLPIPDVFVTAEKVQRGKPDPEHFITTAHCLQQSPENCLVFEDSNNGVQGALHAGCDVVVIGRACTLEHPRIVARLDNYQQLLNALISAEACA